MDSETRIVTALGCGVIIFLGLIVAAGMAGCPHYNVWQQSMSGKAKLREAESSRQIAVEESRAALESAKLLAEAEAERAKGVAEANKIIGESLDGRESYLRYLWITSLKQDGQVIYVPTEAGLPILEAGKR